MWQRRIFPDRARRKGGLAFAVAALVMGTAADVAAGPLVLAQSTAGTSASGQSSTISPYLAPAPDIFEATGRASWDGKRTLQGVWVAHPRAATARRVRIFNTDNGNAVDGALFKRDTGDGASSVLISSEAAQLLGIEPGDTASLRIVAVTPVERPEPTPQPAAPQPQPTPEASTAEAPATPVTEPEPTTAAPATPEAPATEEPEVAIATPQPAPAPDPEPEAEPEPEQQVETEPEPQTPSEPEAEPEPASAEEPAFKWERAPTTPAAPPAAEKEAPQPTPAATAPASKLPRPFIQAGTFGVASNATALIARLKKQGIPAVGKSETVGGRKLTRVLAGPFRTRADRDAAQRTIRGLGLRDAVPVRR